MSRLQRLLLLVAFASAMAAATPLQQPSATFEGQVVDSVTGQPIAGAHVTISSNLGGPPAAARQTSPPPAQTQERARSVRRVEGTVLDEKNQPVAGIRGIALPDPLPDVVGRYYTVYSNPDGHYTIRGIEPGNYRIYVWEGLGELQLFDRELWQRTRASATPVRIDAGSQVTINVRRITP